MTTASEERPKAGHNPYGLKTLWSDELFTTPVSTLSTRVGRQAILSWRAFIAAPVTSVLTVIVMTISLILLATFLLVIENVDRMLAGSEGEVKLALYLKDGVPDLGVQQLLEEVQGLAGVESASLRSKEQNLSLFRESLGSDTVLLEGVESANPIPASIELSLVPGAERAQRFRRYAERFEGHPIVDLVHYNKGFVGRLGAALRGFRFVSGVAVVCLLVVTAVIIGNTIRLALYSHREEIEIMRLVGATDRFVCAPYLIEGFVQGLVGGVGAILAVMGLIRAMARVCANDPVLDLVMPKVEMLSPSALLLVILTGVFVGVAGSLVAVRRFVRSQGKV